MGFGSSAAVTTAAADHRKKAIDPESRLPKDLLLETQT